MLEHVRNFRFVITQQKLILPEIVALVVVLLHEQIAVDMVNEMHADFWACQLSSLRLSRRFD